MKLQGTLIYVVDQMIFAIQKSLEGWLPPMELLVCRIGSSLQHLSRRNYCQYLNVWLSSTTMWLYKHPKLNRNSTLIANSQFLLNNFFVFTMDIVHGDGYGLWWTEEATPTKAIGKYITTIDKSFQCDDKHLEQFHKRQLLWPTSHHVLHTLRWHTGDVWRFNSSYSQLGYGQGRNIIYSVCYWYDEKKINMNGRNKR